MATKKIAINCEYLKDLMSKLDYTQETLALACGISQGMVGHILSGARTGSLDVLKKIADQLQISVDEMLIGNTLESSYITLPFLEAETLLKLKIDEKIQVTQTTSINNLDKQWGKIPDYAFRRSDKIDTSFNFGSYIVFYMSISSSDKNGYFLYRLRKDNRVKLMLCRRKVDIVETYLINNNPAESNYKLSDFDSADCLGMMLDLKIVH